MRLMLRFYIPVESGNEAAADGSMGTIIEELVAKVQPEAAYFMMDSGVRSGFLVFEESDVAKLPQINEPLMAGLEAQIEIMPVLSLADLRRGLSEGD